MKKQFKGSFLKIFIDEADKYNGKPLYTEILAKLKEKDILGATVFRGIEGLDRHHKIHSDFIEILARNLPIIIEVIDSTEKIYELAEILEPMIETGTLTIIDNVNVTRFRKDEQ
ncbi:DUF190 domain-containing protein [Clostridium sp.]|uniref:DUF190 domain-containing protein n=1 Tax=Clostridium sp. TaxID=1506 RepID=UPI00261BDEF9|nr:DUF190 domain-containing protein [Clostridium sp.]